MGTLTNNLRNVLLAGNDNLEPLLPLSITHGNFAPSVGRIFSPKKVDGRCRVELSTLELNSQLLHLFHVFIAPGILSISAHSN